MTPRVGAGLRSQPRHTAPPHRQADGLTTDGNFADPVRVERGRVTLIFDAPLETGRDGKLRISLGGGLAVKNGKLEIDLTQTIAQADLPKLAEDGVTASVGYSQGEAQATMDKVDAVIQALRDGLYKEA